MALHYAEIAVEIREIALKAKPAHMLEVSPKGTVPVLVLPDGKVIDESLDIMHWAIERYDPDHWLPVEQSEEISALITENDAGFKKALDRYKYAIRFPEQTAETYRAQGALFLQKLEQRLQTQPFLCGKETSLADIAIFPFIRQFAMVDEAWFAGAAYPKLRAWLEHWIGNALFGAIMKKYPTWEDPK